MEFIALLVVIGVAVWLQNKLYKKLAFRDLSYACSLSETEVFEGDELELIEVVTNNKWLPLPWLKAEISTSKHLVIAEKTATVNESVRTVSSFFVMRSYRKVERRWKIKARRRGDFDIRNITLVSTDLLGNVALSKPIPVNLHLTVLPRPLNLDEIYLSPRYTSGDLVVKRHLLEDPFYIAGVREYTEREPINRIHWKATAKEQKLMVYNNECTSRQSVTVLLNMQTREVEHHAIMDRDNAENCIRCAAAVFDSTLYNQTPLRLLSNGTTTEDKEHIAGKFAIKDENKPQDIMTAEYWGEEHVMHLLRIMAKLQNYTVDDFPSWLQSNADQMSSTDIVIITSYINEPIADFARGKMLEGVHVRTFLIGKAADIPQDIEVYDISELAAMQSA